jgi:hypothetical protein
VSVIAIQKILCAESIRHCWWSVRQAANPNRGGAVTWLTVPHPAGDTLYATRQGVESQGVAAIETWYKVAQGAPILQDAWLQGDFGLWQTGFGRSGLSGLIYLPREHGYTFQTSIAGGTTHLAQTVKGIDSGYCLNY